MTGFFPGLAVAEKKLFRPPPPVPAPTQAQPSHHHPAYETIRFNGRFR
jgi:hypothetical protein